MTVKVKTSLEYSKGWNDGNTYAASIKRPFKTEDFPPEFRHRNGEYWAGYAEGVKSAELDKLDKRIK